MHKLLLLVLIILTQVSSAFGSAGHEGAGHHAADISVLFPYYFNFVIYAFLLFYLLKNPIISGVRDWAIGVEQEINKGAKALEVAQESLTDAQGKLATLPQAVQDLKERMNKELQSELASIKAEGEKTLKDIERKAAETISSERDNMSKSFKTKLVNAAVASATKKLKSENTKTSDSGRRKEAVSGIGRLGLLQ